MRKKWNRWLAVCIVAGMTIMQAPVAYAEDAADVSEETAVIEDEEVVEESEAAVEDEGAVEESEAVVEDDKTEEDASEEVIEEVPEASEVQVVEETIEATKEKTLNADSGSSRGRWKKTGGRWWFQFEDGSYAVDGRYLIDDVVYAFDADGWMVTGWFLEKWEDPEEGTVTANWYYFDPSGVMYKGWLKSGSKWYYLDKDFGYMHTSWYEIDGKQYRFLDSGAMVTGWHLEKWEDGEESGENWYYFDPSGAMHKGWLKSGSKWYYLDKEVGFLYYGWQEIDGIEYLFDKTGAMVTGWYLNKWEEGGIVSKIWFYFDPSGAMHKGWLKSGGKWYYLDKSDGWMYANGVEEIDGYCYGFDKTGAMVTGWYYVEGFGEWGYFESDGKGRTGWVQSKGSWYWIDEGWMVIGEKYYQTDDGKWSLFDEETGKWIRYEEPPREQ